MIIPEPADDTSVCPVTEPKDCKAVPKVVLSVSVMILPEPALVTSLCCVTEPKEVK